MTNAQDLDRNDPVATTTDPSTDYRDSCGFQLYSIIVSSWEVENDLDSDEEAPEEIHELASYASFYLERVLGMLPIDVARRLHAAMVEEEGELLDVDS